MSDKGEKTCPLCTEEMDLTDQQLKPCKCGYEICVWCWHHVMDMAEKDDTEGRCPACRTPYDKEKIVGMANCGSLVAEINLERKQKVQKAKPKASEGRKHLSTVRVIQRNLVYVVGLPLSCADEELLKHREYFGQYGKVLKVSISRTASGVIQHSSNDSFSVYITYSKEAEAVRCIQSVHYFMLEGRSLRACLGTSKYCHSWLKNVPCSNAHCLYLHDFGSQEDCFTKDEIVSAVTRSRVEQIVGATHYMQRCSGNVLPPPADEYKNIIISSTLKPAVKDSSNNFENRGMGSVSDISTGKSCAPPSAASWVARVSTCWPSVANSSGLTGPGKQKPETSNPMVLPSVVVGTKKLEPDVGNRSTMAEESSEVHPDGKLDPSNSTLHYIDRKWQTTVPKKNAEDIPDTSPTTLSSTKLSHSLPPLKEGGGNMAVSSTLTSSVRFTKQSHRSGPDKDGNIDVDGKLQSVCSGLSSISVDSSLEDKHSVPVVLNSSPSNHFSMEVSGNQCFQLDNSKQHREPLTSLALKEATSTVNPECVPKEDSLVYDDQGLKGFEGVNHPLSMPFSPSLLQMLNQSSCHSWQSDGVCNGNTINTACRNVPFQPDVAPLPSPSCNSVLFSEGIDNKANSFTDSDRIIERSDLFPDIGKGTYLGRSNSDVDNVNNHGTSDMGESHIISNIMSFDLDAWDDSLTTSHSFAKFLAGNDKRHGSHRLPNLGKVQNSSQSRFLFAREEDLSNQMPDLEHSFNTNAQEASKLSFPQDSTQVSGSFADSDNLFSSQPFTSSNKLPFSKGRISTPPGFSVPSRAPPPGFSSQERVDLALHNSPANHSLQTPSFSGRPIQFSPIGNVGSPVDVELNDPAILEVGKGIPTTGLNNTGLGMWQTSSAHLSSYEHEARLRLLMQQRVSVHQNPRLVNHFGIRFSSHNDVYSTPMLHSGGGNLSPFAQHLRNTESNGHWGSWNEVKSINNPGGLELLTNEKVGFNKLIPGYENVNFQMPGTGYLYNREFGI